jgi:hypothetical protein
MTKRIYAIIYASMRFSDRGFFLARHDFKLVANQQYLAAPELHSFHVSVDEVVAGHETELDSCR